ncbi:MAG: glycerol-3-phosphate ABC transporter ATP-binding protein [Zetaproteobacteria bacterium]|nr:glycerol-3-phosphate ABC transporter ATP-binding protein [Pseudobdellovibrionaceae bacterium]
MSQHQLEITKLNKIYDKKVHVLKDIDLEINEKEFLVLVGPSGCGKSTLLRSIAGLEGVTSGDISIAGRTVTDLAPADRDIAMVFQDYALYPHMTVRDNLSFGLRMRKLPKDEIDEQVNTAAAMLGIEELLDRRPSQLSGGQRQRVAIGRAVVRRAQLFLFDEPLSNLDAKLRSQTRIELADLHRKVGATSVYVTHDQVEAMTLADRIVVLNKGVIQQQGAPMDLYREPANCFVASFIGSPTMNFFPGKLTRTGGKATFCIGNDEIDLSDCPVPEAGGDYVLGIRPEAIKVLAKQGREAEGKVDMKVTVNLIEPHGHEAHMVATLAGHQAIIRSANPHRLKVMTDAHRGDLLDVTFDREAMHFFDTSSEGLRVKTTWIS